MNFESPQNPAPRLVAVVAMASNRVIGRQGALPWHLPEDLRFFKETTLGHPVLMGRKTLDSIVARIGKPLPGRRNLVVSRTLPPRDGIEILHDIRELATLPGLASPVFLIGGAQLYEALLPRCDEIILTWIEQPYEGDAFFPPFEDAFALDEIIGSAPGCEFRRYRRLPAS